MPAVDRSFTVLTQPTATRSTPAKTVKIIGFIAAMQTDSFPPSSSDSVPRHSRQEMPLSYRGKRKAGTVAQVNRLLWVLSRGLLLRRRFCLPGLRRQPGFG